MATSVLSSRQGKPTEPIPSDSEGSTTDSREDDDDDEEGWDDVEKDDEDGDTQEVISLLDDRVFPDVASMLAHCRGQHGLDFLAVRQRLQLDFHGSVRLVNYIRQRVHEGLPVTGDAITAADIADDRYLKPVLDDDAVILGLFDLPDVGGASGSANNAVAGEGGEGKADVEGLVRRNAELREELARVSAQFENYRAAVQRTLDQRWGVSEGFDDEDRTADVAGVVRRETGKPKGKDANPNDESKYYWESYSGVEIHETMLKDKVRTDAYRDFIYNNKHLFKDKTVLDIGCGTGILSMFCARAGAKRVYAVDASAIISKARANVARNGLSSTITCVHGKMEEVTLPGLEAAGGTVDVIVSEWMGYCLLFEAMLPSVLWARDRYLRRDGRGLMVPSHASLWAAPAADPRWAADHARPFWHDVYGFDMRSMAAGLEDEARVLVWPADGMAVSAPSPSPSPSAPTPALQAFKVLDLYTATTADLSFAAPFTATLDRVSADPVDGFLVWFDIFFSPTAEDHGSQVGAADTANAWTAAAAAQNQAIGDRVAFSTGPWSEPTHWCQGLLLCKYEDDDEEGGREGPKGEKRAKANAVLKLDKGDRVEGSITFAVDPENPRGLSIGMRWNGDRSQTWTLR